MLWDVDLLVYCCVQSIAALPLKCDGLFPTVAGCKIMKCVLAEAS